MMAENSNTEDNPNEEHQHDQLPTVDEILVDRGQGRVLSGSSDAEVDDDRREPRSKNGGCWVTPVKVLLLAMLVAFGFAIGFLAGDLSFAAASSASDGNRKSYSPADKKTKETQDREKIEALANAGSNSDPIPAADILQERLEVTKEDLIDQGLAIGGGSEFENPKSYQSRALDVLIENGVSAEDDFSKHGRQKLAQRYALLCLYYSTNGVRTAVTDAQFGYGTTPHWHNNNVPAPWKFQWGDDECDWSGVVCNTHNLVERIELVNHLLTGFLPMELKLLNDGPIEVMDFSENRGLGEGGFPKVFSEFDSLASIGLQGTSFTGRVPQELCEKQSIDSIYIDCQDIECECCSSCDRAE